MKKVHNLTSTVESFKKQQARDQMIIKFRDATIKRFSGKEPVDPSAKEEIEALRKETEMLKEQIETNPETARLFAENQELIQERDELKAEVS